MDNEPISQITFSDPSNLNLKPDGKLGRRKLFIAIFVVVLIFAASIVISIFFITSKTKTSEKSGSVTENEKGTMEAAKETKEEKKIYAIPGDMDISLGFDLKFVPSSENFSFTARREKDWYMVDEKGEVGPFKSIHRKTYSISGKRFAYWGMKDTNPFLIVDVENIPVSGRTDEVVFSHNDLRYAYSVWNDNQAMSAYVDGKFIRSFGYLDALENDKGGFDDFVFSPDDSHLAFAYADRTIDGKNKKTVVIDGKEVGTYNWVYRFAFSPDSKHYAMSVSNSDENSFIVMDGREIKNYKSSSDPVYLADGRLAYIARKGDMWVIILDGKEIISEKEGIYSFSFSPDGNKVAYSKSGGSGVWEAVFDEKELGKYGIIGNQDGSPAFFFSPDGQQLAFIAGDGSRNKYIVQNGQKQKSYSKILNAQFSPDGNHFAYNGYSGTGEINSGSYVVVIDGKYGTSNDDIYDPHFTSDSKKYIYKARRGKDIFLVTENID
jgi:hypothetical protein